MGKVTIVAGKSGEYTTKAVGAASKKAAKVVSEHLDKLEKHVDTGMKAATVKESKKIKNLKLRQQNQILKSILKLGEELKAILDAYESLLLDCLESKTSLREHVCPFDIRYEKAKEDDLTAAEKILDLLERIKINLNFIDEALEKYINFPDLLGKSDVQQYTYYAKYITTIKKIMDTDENVLHFDWYHVKGKDRFKNFDKVKSIFEKIAKNYLYMVETCTNAVDCMYASLMKPWRKHQIQINQLTDGGLGFVPEQGVQQEQQIRRLRKTLMQQQKSSPQQVQLAQEVKKHKQKLLRRLKRQSLLKHAVTTSQKKQIQQMPERGGPRSFQNMLLQMQQQKL